MSLMNKVERTHLKIPNTKRKYAKAWTSNKQNKKQDKLQRAGIET